LKDYANTFWTHKKFGHGQLVDVSIEDRNATIVYFNEPEDQSVLALDALEELKRYILPIGTVCSNEDGRRCKIEKFSTKNDDDINVYSISFEDGLTDFVPENSLTYLRTPGFSSPVDQIISGTPDGLNKFTYRERLIRNYKGFLVRTQGLISLISSRIDLQPHQAFTAATVLRDPIRRYILADEVGLGKTIETGIIFSDFLRHKPSARVLIICPSALTQQWLAELYSKFGKQIFYLLDLHGEEGNPQNHNLVISSFVAVESYQEQLLTDWDLVIVDEVHHILSMPNLYEFIKEYQKN